LKELTISQTVSWNLQIPPKYCNDASRLVSMGLILLRENQKVVTAVLMSWTIVNDTAFGLTPKRDNWKFRQVLAMSIFIVIF
jgi:hypothetical protein